MVDPVWEEIVEHIDSLVMAAVECDTSNLATIIKVHDKLMEITERVLETSYPALAQLSQKAAEMAMSVVLQEAENPETALEIVINATSTLQLMSREILNDHNPAYIPIPEGLGLNAETIFAKQEPAIAPKAVPETAVQKIPGTLEKPESKREEGEFAQPAMPEASAEAKSASTKTPVFDMGSLTSSHLADFISEFNDLIHRAENQLLALEKSPVQTQEEIHDLLGAFHTIKGISGIIKLQDITNLSHTAEVLLENVSFVPKQGTDLLFEAIDIFKTYSMSLNNYYEKQIALEVPDVCSLIERLKKTDLTSFEKPPVRKVVSVQKEAPVQTTIPKQFPLAQKEPDEKTAKPASEPIVHEEEAIQRASVHLEAGKISDKYLKEAQYGQEEVKIRTDRLDSLIDAIGELVIAESMVENDPEIPKISNAQSLRNIVNMSKICRQLQTLAMSMRMVTIQSTFQTMERMVRDLASKQQKQIEVVVEGENTELDRNVIETMYNPMVHMVRNAVDHGIETPQERIAMGKSKKGRITMRAYHHGGNIVISIEDDGKGLDRAKIFQKALQMGLLKQDREYSEDEIFKIIFLPGFTTATEISEISGRGVGLDVVKKSIEKFRGTVDVASKKGEGTIFRVTLPLTLAIIDGMMIRVENERYIIPLVNIEEFVNITPHQISTISGKGEVLKLRGEIIPIFHLARMLVKNYDAHKEKASIGVIVSWENKKCCLIVHELISQQQVVIKNLGSDFNKIVGVSGAAILGDGRVGLILDIHNILSMAGITGMTG